MSITENNTALPFVPRDDYEGPVEREMNHGISICETRLNTIRELMRMDTQLGK